MARASILIVPPFGLVAVNAALLTIEYVAVFSVRQLDAELQKDFAPPAEIGEPVGQPLNDRKELVVALRPAMHAEDDRAAAGRNVVKIDTVCRDTLVRQFDGVVHLGLLRRIVRRGLTVRSNVTEQHQDARRSTPRSWPATSSASSWPFPAVTCSSWADARRSPG